MKAAYINNMKGVQVFDDNGNDVTPLPLFSPNKSHRNVGGSSGAGSQSSNEVKHVKDHDFSKSNSTLF